MNENRKVIENDDYQEARLAFKKYFLNHSDNKLTRLTPSIQNNNQADYTYLVREIVHGNKSNEPQYRGNRRITKAFNHFKERIENYAGDDVDTLFKLLDKITAACGCGLIRKMRHLHLSCLKHQQPGRAAYTDGLIKNSMISSLKNQSAEQTNEEWQQIINNLNDYDVQVRYLRHFYQAFKPIGLIWDKDKGKDKLPK